MDTDMTNKRPGKLGVITVTKDDIVGLEETLESARAQTDQNFRHLIIDSSNSSPAVKKLVSQYTASYYWVPPEGIYPAMEFGLKKLHDSDYCWFLNSSDTFFNKRAVEVVRRTLTSGESEAKTWVLGQVLLVGPRGSKIYSATAGSHDLLATARKGRIYFPHSSTIVSVEKLRSVEPFRENLEIAQDYLIALKILSRFGPPTVIEEVLSAFKLGGLSSQKTVKTGLETVKARMIVFGSSQAPRELWNVVRILGGRPLKKMYVALRSQST